MKRKLSAHTVYRHLTPLLSVYLCLGLRLFVLREVQLFLPLSLRLGLHLSAKHPFPLFASVVTLPLSLSLSLSLSVSDMIWEVFVSLCMCMCVLICIFEIVLHIATVAGQTFPRVSNQATPLYSNCWSGSSPRLFGSSIPLASQILRTWCQCVAPFSLQRM